MNSGSKHINTDLLVEYYQNGDKEALKQLIRVFHPRLLYTIKYHTRDFSPVEDIAQECWYAIIRKLDDVELKISFEVWAITIARRKAIDWIREQQRSRRYDHALRRTEASRADEKPVNDRGKLDQIRFAIRQLSPSQQIVLTMFYLENLSLEEISEVLEIAEGTVKSRLFYAREKLKSIISKQTGDYYEKK